MKKILILIFSGCFFISNSQIISEDFSSGMIPSSWTVNTYANNTCGGFVYDPIQVWPNSTITGPHMGAFSWSPAGTGACQSGANVMIPFNGSGFTSIDIDLDHHYLPCCAPMDTNDKAGVWYTDDGGTNWNQLQEFTGAEYSGALHYNITNPSSNMALAFEHLGYNGNYWDIDNIVITGNGSVGSGCTHTFNMYDSYGDGWNGASVNVTVNGATVVWGATGVDLGLSSTPGPCGTENFQASAGDAIALTNWVSGGFDTEISWDIKDGNGTVIASGGTMANGGGFGLPGTCIGDCGVSSSWACISPGNCIDPGNGSGPYPTQAVCMINCPASSWACINGSCIDPGNGSGPYPTQALCQASGCGGPAASWDCISAGNCQDPGTGNGLYATQALCIADCASVIAGFSANITAACVGQSIQFSDASSGNPNSWLWDFGDGNSSFQTNPSHQYTSAGTYTVTLDVSNAISTNSTFQTNYIVVIDAVDATWTSNPAGQANIGQIISFTADSVAPTTWDWDWDDWTTNGSGPNETHSYSNTGTYNVCLTVTNSCSNDNSCQLIEILDPCVSSTEIYLTNIAFTSSVDEVGTIWETDFTGLPTSLVKPTTNPSNLLNAGRKVSFKIECRNEKVNGQAIVSGMCEIISSDPYITIIDGTAGLNNVAWQNEAWSTDEFTIEISNDAPAGYLANIEFKVIEGSIAEYTRCVKIPVQPLTISNIDIDDDSNPDSDGDDDDICEPGETIEVYPYVDNISLLEAGLVAGTMTCSNPNINIWDGQSGISGTVEKDAWWNVSFGNPSPIIVGATGMTPEFDFVFDYNLNQVAPVPLTVVFTGGFQLFDINGSAKSALIRFSSDYYINEDLLNSTEDIATNNLIKIFPNPFKEIVTIEANISKPYTLKLYDVTGKLLRDYKNINNDKLIIERGSLNSGVYLLKIINDSDIRMGRLIIE